MMFKIVEKKELAPKVNLFRIISPEIANKAKAGQFVIIRMDEKGERIPLTLADWNRNNGTITIIFQEAGLSTSKLGKLEIGEEISNLLGPLGNPSNIKDYGSVAVVCGGVGTAAAYPIVKALKEAGNQVVTILGARNEEMLILENEMKKYSDEFYISTDDGSKGNRGFVSDVLKTLIEKEHLFDLIYAIGPPLMMRATVGVAKSHSLKTIVSLNPIMVDGCGMCGACRVIVGGETKFACMDGPEFNGQNVNFEELIRRQRLYIPEEQTAFILYEKLGEINLG